MKRSGLFVLAAVLWAWMMPLAAAKKAPPPYVDTLGFKHIQNIALENLAQQQQWLSRDKSPLLYRRYSSATGPYVVVLHSAGLDDSYLMSLGRYLSDAGVAEVLTLTLRGHALTPKNKNAGDVAYLDQYSDDVADVVAQLRTENSWRKVVLAGHGFGGGVVIRALEKQVAVDGVLLLSPFLDITAATYQVWDQDFADLSTWRLAALEMLNAVGVDQLNRQPVVQWKLPPNNTTATRQYSYRLLMSGVPRDYCKSLGQVLVPVRVIAALNDGFFRGDKYRQDLQNCGAIDVVEKDLSHFELVTSTEVLNELAQWINKKI